MARFSDVLIVKDEVEIMLVMSIQSPSILGYYNCLSMGCARADDNQSSKLRKTFISKILIRIRFILSDLLQNLIEWREYHLELNHKILLECPLLS
jgi:hypothetical protein